MSEITKTSTLFNREATIAAYQGRPNVCLGTEIEMPLASLPCDGSKPAMMTPQQSQSLMERMTAQPGTTVYSEDRGTRIPGRKEGLPIVMVQNDAYNLQLEFSGVLEAATAAVPVNNINMLLNTIEELPRIISQLAAPEELGIYDGPFLSSATIPDCERNGVNRERLQSEWHKFKQDGPGSPGLRTMGFASSTQCSFGYRNNVELGEMLRAGNLLAPLLIAAFANGSGFEENILTNRNSRSEWWNQHNAYAPRAGVPDFALGLMFDEKPKDAVAEWINYAASTPMVYHYNENGQPEFATSPSFNTLQKNGLGTQANFSLAESLTWPDVKIIGGQRVEIRPCDSGVWQPTALTVLCAGLLVSEKGRGQLLDTLYGTGITRENYIQARENVTYEGLDTSFGNTNLRSLVPVVFDLACENAAALGVDARYMTGLRALQNLPVSDFEVRQGMYQSAIQADRAILTTYDPARLPLTSHVQNVPRY